MKKVKMARVFFILIGLVSYLVGSAQSDYVVTTKNDTIRGKAKFLNFESNKKIQITAAGKKSFYPITQTKVLFMENETFVPVRYEQNYVLMKVLQSGYLSLYAFQPTNQTLWDGRYLLTRDNRALEVPNLGFKKNMTRYLGGCPELTARIQSEELTKKDLTKIIDEYNSCIDAATQRSLTQSSEPEAEKGTTWDKLEKTVTQLEDFNTKSGCLEMIKDIKLKVNRKEAIPNYIIDALTNALKDQAYATELLKQAIQETKP